MCRGVNHNVVRRLEGHRVVFAQRERIQRAVGRILGGALQGQRSRTVRQLVLLAEVQIQAHDRRVWHDGGRDRTGGLRWREEVVPAQRRDKIALKSFSVYPILRSI